MEINRVGPNLGFKDQPCRLDGVITVANPVDDGAVDDGSRLVGRAALLGVPRSRCWPPFWSNALITALILFGPAIVDSASGKSVLAGAFMRTFLFIIIALYAWSMVWLLVNWHAVRVSAHYQPKEYTI